MTNEWEREKDSNGIASDITTVSFTYIQFLEADKLIMQYYNLLCYGKIGKDLWHTPIKEGKTLTEVAADVYNFVYHIVNISNVTTFNNKNHG